MENTNESITIDPNTGEIIHHYHITDQANLADGIQDLEDGIRDGIRTAVIQTEELRNIPPIFYDTELDTDEVEVEPAPEPRFMPIPDVSPIRHSEDTVKRRRAFVQAVKRDQAETLRVLSTSQLKKREDRRIRKLITGQHAKISGHDIIIQQDAISTQVDHCMRSKPATLKHLEHINRNESLLNGVHNIFYFDKNFNHLIMDNWHSKKSPHRVLRGVYPRFKGSMVKDQSMATRDVRKQEAHRFLVIDKKKFIDSKGDMFVIKQKQGFTYKEILKVKVSMRKQLKHAERFINRIKKIIGSVYDEENFDIFYGLVFEKTVPNNIHIFIKFPDVTIKNSIEMEHYLGDIFVRLGGYHDARFKFRIESNLYGMRGTFAPLDRVLKWSHSHLAKSNDSQGFSSFCIGGDNHMFSGNYYGDYRTSNTGQVWETTPLEFESILLSIEDFLSWESLEGGPYNRMEDIKLHGNKVERLSSIDELGCNDPFLTEKLFKRILAKKNLESLKSSFKIIKNEDRARYVVNYNSFFYTVLSMFDENEIAALCAKYKQRTLLYNPSKNEFYHSTVGDLGSWASVKDKARQMLPVKRIIYMNGKYHKPTLIKMDETPNDLQGNLVSVDPIFLTRVARTILHQLTTKLIENE